MLADLLFRIRGLFRRGSVESELSDEIEFHVERETEKLMRGGLPPREAARRARLAFGFPEQVKEQCRDERGTRWIEQFVQDTFYALRMLRLNPTFAVVAVVSLGLGIGANTAIFQLLDAVRPRMLPVRAPQELQLVRIGGDGPSGNFTSRYSHLSFAQWEQIRSQQQAFSNVLAWSPRRFNLASGGEMRPAEGMLVSGTFFETLGVPAWRGRTLDARDDQPGNAMPAAVISYAFWQREFGGAPDAIGRALNVDGHAFTIVGVTHATFFGVDVGRSFDVAAPISAEDQLAGVNSQLKAKRDNYWLCVIGRLRPDWTGGARQRTSARDFGERLLGQSSGRHGRGCGETLSRDVAAI